MKGRRPWLSLACGCCCGDTGSTPALPISHSFPLSRSFTAQMLSCPVPARPSPTAAAPGTASPRPAHPGWLGRCAPAFLLPMPFPCLQPGGNHPHLEHPSLRSRELWQEPASGGGWRGPAPGAAAAPPAVPREQLPGGQRVTVAQPMPAQMKAERRSVIQPLALKSFMKRLNCSASSAQRSRAIRESEPMAPRPSPLCGASGGSGTAPAPAERAQLVCGNSPLCPRRVGQPHDCGSL